MIEHTYIELMGWTLADPLTFLSDLLMSAVCLFCGHRLFYDYKGKYAKFFGLFFLFLGVSAFLGGTSHLLDEYLGKTAHMFAWLVQGIAILFVELACIRLIEKIKYKNLLRAIVYGSFGIFISRIFTVQSFDVVKLNSTIGLIGFVFIIHLVRYYRTRLVAYLNVSLAIALFLIPAAIHGFGIFYNAWIDQNVISHLLLLPCYYLLYRSVGKVALTPKNLSSIII